MSPKTVVITGAGSGIGRAMALTWADRGCTVGVSDYNAEGAARTVELIESAGGSADSFCCDVRSEEDLEAMAAHFFERWGRVDVLVNNAGVIDAGTVGEVAMEDWRRVMGTCFWGAVHGCHAFIPRMKRQGGGHIVNVASIAGIISLPEAAPYNTAKAAVVSLSETLRSELAPHRIGVTVVCPSILQTNLLEGMTVTDEWENDFIRSAFANSRMGADRIAEKVVAAVDSNRLFVFPQSAAKLARALMRLCPRTFYALLALLYRSRLRRPAFMWLARRGLT
ncbi:MAG: SDR family NAD(P)-dependent oxidoreductase [Actinomycetota bacterium]